VRTVSKKTNIEKAKHLFLTPTASKKIWRQKSQSGNPEATCEQFLHMEISTQPTTLCTICSYWRYC